MHVEAGRRHLLTEDVVRFATVTVLADHGVTVDRVGIERTVAGVGRIDLVIDDPGGAAIEFKFPREPSEFNAADTMAFGELLRDFYRLASLDVAEAWAVQLIRPAFARYLARRSELRWTATAGDDLLLPLGLPETLPATARNALGAGPGTAVHADCVMAEHLGDDVLVAYRVHPGIRSTS